MKGVFTMKLSLTPEAASKLAPLFDDPTSIVLLDYGDGNGFLAEGKTECTLNQAFRILIVHKDCDFHEYNQHLSTSIGNFYYKDYTRMFMDDEMTIKLNPRDQQLSLHGQYRGIITANLKILDYRDQENDNRYHL